MSHNSLRNHLMTMFNMQQFHGYDLNTLEDMIIFEKDVYVLMIKEIKG